MIGRNYIRSQPLLHLDLGAAQRFKKLTFLVNFALHSYTKRYFDVNEVKFTFYVSGPKSAGEMVLTSEYKN